MPTLPEAAARLGVAASTLRVQIHKGKLRSVKRGRDHWITEGEIERYRLASLGRGLGMYGTTLRNLKVGDRVRAAGYVGDDGWATVTAVEDRAVLVRFADGETARWPWGREAKGRTHVVVDDK